MPYLYKQICHPSVNFRTKYSSGQETDLIRYCSRGFCCISCPLIYLFISDCWVFIATHGLYLQRAGVTLELQYIGFLLQRLSFVADHGLYGTCAQQLWCTAQLPCDTWDLPGPGTEPVFPALCGTLLTIGPPAKPLSCPLIPLPSPSENICPRRQQFQKDEAALQPNILPPDQLTLI